MKRSIISIGVLFAAVNLLFGWILSAFGWVNVAASTLIIILTAIILLVLNSGSNTKNGFVVSLNLIFPAFGLLQYLLAVFMPDKVDDNWCLIAIIILLAIEAAVFIAVRNVSRKIN